MHTPATMPPQPPSPDPASDAATRAARFWTPRHVATLAAGRWLHEPADLDQPLAGIGIDTRTLGRGEIFLAIHGPRFDGHDFLAAAREAGAAMAIVEKVPAAETDLPLLRVDSTLDALHRLARAWRAVLAAAGCRVIAVAGSNGKTTTRHLVHTALQGSVVPGAADAPASPLTGTQSPHSFNNHLGVPLTLLAARAADDFVVAEIGTNHVGEIAALAEIARPDAAVITSIGREHMEHFGSLEAVAREEAAVLDHVAEGGLAAIEADAWRQITAVRKLPRHLNVVRFGTGDEADLRHAALRETPDGLEFEVAGGAEAPSAAASPGEEANGRAQKWRLPLLGRHNASNALAAVIVGRWLGVADDQLAAQLARVDAMPGRLEVRPIGTPPDAVLVLHDAYNANPDSMHAALETLAGLEAETAARRRVAVLGDMAELGTDGPAAHRQLGDDLAEHGETIDHVLLVGRLTLFTAEALARHWPNERVHVLGPLNDASARQIAEMLQPGDVVLLKASRSVALERVLPALEQRFAT